MKYYIYTAADYNDGDYVHEKTEITEDQLTLLKQALSKVPREQMYNSPQKLKSFRWETNDQGDTALELTAQGILTDEEADIINEFVPSHEYGIHTVISMTLIVVSEETELL